LSAITCQRTKFNYVVSQLIQRHDAEVENIITTPTEDEPYDRLNADLVQRFSTSREYRLRQLLSHEEVGDRKPSQFPRHLKGLTPDVPDEFLRTNWASRLPPQVQAILTGQIGDSVESTSLLADKICKVTTQPSTTSISPAVLENTAGLQERTEELSRQVISLHVQQTNSHSQSRVRHR